ncbi:MAG: YitT family protein [Chitinophagales bacterium]|nr:YitT family protein [Chitinophagales bacterium]
MNWLWKQIISKTVLRNKNSDHNVHHSNIQLARGLHKLRETSVRLLKDALLIIAGIFSAAFGFKGFLLTNHFIDGGATGVSLLISALTAVPLYILIISINIPFIFLGYKSIGKAFAIKTTLAISGLALCLATVHFPDVTKDNLLVAVFGGFFLGAGIGLTVRGGAVIDGTEVLAIYLSKKLGTTIGDIIILINVFIFMAAAYFLSVEIALYSMITYLSASRTLDFITEGIEEYTGVTIISPKAEQMRRMIIEKLGRGVTIYSGKRGFGKTGEATGIDIVYTVVTRLELNRLNAEIKSIDANAFVVMSSVRDTKGGMIKKRSFTH